MIALYRLPPAVLRWLALFPALVPLFVAAALIGGLR